MGFIVGVNQLRNTLFVKDDFADAFKNKALQIIAVYVLIFAALITVIVVFCAAVCDQQIFVAA
ncbi:MAG: hypothetical protein FWE19_05940 [Oscillospiraceae bacterium]|nr:hypothetical protein [Oscillospiraceae bacterium]